jgi:hypothetical protein
MKTFRIALLFGTLVLASATAFSQAPARVRGTIVSVDGNVLMVKSREGNNVRIDLDEKTTFAYMKALNIADVRPGTPLGSAAVKGPDGKLIARELHLFNPDRPIPSEGHGAWDLEPGSTMTNARVTQVVQAVNARVLTLSYKDGSQQITVPENVPVVMAVESDRSLLVPGAYTLVLGTASADGKVRARRVQVTKDGVRPPH